MTEGAFRNPGRFEMFYGEVEDIHAAREYLAKLPYVDSERIYLTGHSTGGTLTLLAAELHGGFRAAFSLGGIPDLEKRLKLGSSSTPPPFDLDNPREYQLRSPERFVTSLKSPTFYFRRRGRLLGRVRRHAEKSGCRGARISCLRGARR